MDNKHINPDDIALALEQIARASTAEQFESTAKFDRFQEQIDSLIEIIHSAEISQLTFCQTLFPNVAEKNYRFELSRFIGRFNKQAQSANIEFTLPTHALPTHGRGTKP